MSKTLTLAAAILLLATGFSQAAVRNFFAPEVDGKRLDSCLTGAQDCGKPAADAFCKVQGFESALLFQRETVADTSQAGQWRPLHRPNLQQLQTDQMLLAEGRFRGDCELAASRMSLES